MRTFDDIWFTFKSRIAAEQRLKNYDFHSQLLLVWYAIISSTASLYALRHEKFAGADTDIYMAVLSVALLVISLFVSTRDFRGRAMQMRANHIALKCLHDELVAGTVKPEKKPALYSKLLLECENHTSYDDRYFRVFNKAGLTSRPPTRFDYVFVVGICALKSVFYLALYLLPISVFWMKIGQ
jgi:hypothetical protein